MCPIKRYTDTDRERRGTHKSDQERARHVDLAHKRSADSPPRSISLISAGCCATGEHEKAQTQTHTFSLECRVYVCVFVCEFVQFILGN